MADVVPVDGFRQGALLWPEVREGKCQVFQGQIPLMPVIGLLLSPIAVVLTEVFQLLPQVLCEGRFGDGGFLVLADIVVDQGEIDLAQIFLLTQ